VHPACSSSIRQLMGSDEAKIPPDWFCAKYGDSTKKDKAAFESKVPGSKAPSPCADQWSRSGDMWELSAHYDKPGYVLSTSPKCTDPVPDVLEQAAKCSTKLTAPTCASKVEVRIAMSSTCCGTESAQMKLEHQLIHGNQKNCGAWMTVVDLFARTIFSGYRTCAMAMWYNTNCFAKS